MVLFEYDSGSNLLLLNELFLEILRIGTMLATWQLIKLAAIDRMALKTLKNGLIFSDSITAASFLLIVGPHFSHFELTIKTAV